MSRTKIGEFTLDALRTRQSLVKGERLVRHEMRAVLRLVRLRSGGLLSVNPYSGGGAVADCGRKFRQWGSF